MSNAQPTMDSLRELNTRLLAEIAELRKENAKIPELEKKLLKFAKIELNFLSQLKARSDELEKTIADYSVKIGKLNAIIVELEKTNAVITTKVTKLESENVELKAEIAKLRYDINAIKQQTFPQPEMLPEVTIISKEMISGDG
jgi:septal ring factor EnvC (AmiA/AmiB activator)